MTQVVLSSDDTAKITGDAAILARRYSGALYSLAAEEKQLEAVVGDIRLLDVLMRQSEEMRLLAKHVRFTPVQRLSVIKVLAGAANLNALTTNFLNLLIRHDRLAFLGAMTQAFLSRYAEERGEFTAEVASAKPLTPAQQEQLSTKLREMAGGKVHLSLHEDASLLGGFVVKIGSQLIDASVKGTLDRLERQLMSEQLVMQKGAA